MPVLDYHLINSDEVGRLLGGNNLHCPQNSNVLGVIACINDTLYGAAILNYVEKKSIYALNVISVKPLFRRNRIGSELLTIAVKYVGSKNTELICKFNSEQHDIDIAKSFFVKNGAKRVFHDHTQYTAGVDELIETFGKTFSGINSAKYRYKSYHQLDDRELQIIQNHNSEGYSLHLRPDTYPGMYDNDFSIYVISENGDVCGWNIVRITAGQLYVRCSYTLPAYRTKFIWLHMLQYMLSNNYTDKIIGKIEELSFCTSFDNAPVAKFIKRLVKKINVVEHYTAIFN